MPHPPRSGSFVTIDEFLSFLNGLHEAFLSVGDRVQDTFDRFDVVVNDVGCLDVVQLVPCLSDGSGEGASGSPECG